MSDIYEIRMRGPGMNALGTTLMRWLRNELVIAAGRPVLLTGAGAAFSAGLNLKELLSLDGEAMQRFLEDLDGLACALFDYPGPTAALINGHVIAGGAILALCCDERIAEPTDGARIGLNEVALGLRFPPRILRIVQHRLPRLTCAEVVLGAALYTPEGAQRVGLVHTVTADAGDLARGKLDALHAHPAGAYAATKADLQAGVTAPRDGEHARFVANVLPQWTSPDLHARIRAILRR